MVVNSVKLLSVWDESLVCGWDASGQRG